jgi:hypothetical protein
MSNLICKIFGHKFHHLLIPISIKRNGKLMCLECVIVCERCKMDMYYNLSWLYYKEESHHKDEEDICADGGQ